MPRRTTRRLLIAAVLAGVLTVGLAAIVVVATREGTPSDVTSEPDQTPPPCPNCATWDYWQVEVPPGWRVQRYDCFRLLGIRVSNASTTLDPCAPTSEASATYAAVDVGMVAVAFSPVCPDTSIPRSIEALDVHPSAWPHLDFGRADVYANGRRYYVGVVLGTEISARDRVLAGQVVASITRLPGQPSLPDPTYPCPTT